MVGMKKLAKSVARVCVVVVLLVLVIGTAGINMLMFHPGMVKGGYDALCPDMSTSGRTA